MTSSKTVNKELTAIVIAAVLIFLCIVGGALSQGSNESACPSSQSTSSVQYHQGFPKETAGSEAEGLSPATSADNLVVRFVDVGQGDGTIVEFPDGKTMLIDTGARGASAVKSVLATDKRSTIDWLVATHPDADHIGGLPAVMDSYTVKSVWAPRVNHSTQTYTRFLEAVKRSGASSKAAQAGMQIASGEKYAIELLWPPAGISYDNTNDYSAVVLVTFGATKFLFTGDAPVEALKQAVGDSVKAPIDALKVSHHGSASGTDEDFAQMISPKIAVISYGDNTYGHPTRLVLDVLEKANAQIYGTGVNGTVTVESDGTQVRGQAQREGKVVAQSKDAGIGSRGL